MHESNLTARKIAYFDTKLFDSYRFWARDWNWDPIDLPRRYLRYGDDTYLIYLPNNDTRVKGFSELTKTYPKEIDQLWTEIIKPVVVNYIVPLTEIADPVIVQCDIARMRPVTGDTVMHTDTRYHQRYSRRYNIAIDTNPDCWLYHYSYDLNNGGSRDHISEGELWEINNKIVHTAVNYGKTWRTHLIVDIMPQNYWNRMCELYDPYAKVPNPQGKNHTYDYDIAGNLIDEPLFRDLPHCFSARTHI